MNTAFDRFENYPISTQTLIISTNVTIDCQKFYDFIEPIQVSKPPTGKTRMLVQENDIIKDGDIVFVQYKTTYKGILFKKISEKYFLNSVTIIMKVHDKFINIKVSNKGKLQITGCSQDAYAITILKKFWEMVRDRKELWSFQEGEVKGEVFKASIIPVMCNINFAIDFQINRGELNNIINTKTDHVSILEPSDGYVGVNIKISTQEEPLENILLDQYIYSDGEWKISKSKFTDYIQTLTPKEQKKKMSKCYVNTFLVFYSGKVIMSGGISYTNRKRAYEMFMEIIHKYRTEIIAN
jgi:TATA-box binding protein (TBP) (component of TFIID and TFIIIB)